MQKELRWSFYYADYVKKYTKLSEIYTKYSKDDYKNISEKDLINIGQIYKDTFSSLINLCKYFLWNNAILVEEEHLIVIYMLHYNTISNGYDFYNLYRGMYNLPKKKYKISMKYLNKKYFDILSEYKEFFEARIEQEKEYEMVY